MASIVRLAQLLTTWWIASVPGAELRWQLCAASDCVTCRASAMAGFCAGTSARSWSTVVRVFYSRADWRKSTAWPTSSWTSSSFPNSCLSPLALLLTNR